MFETFKIIWRENRNVVYIIITIIIAMGVLFWAKTQPVPDQGPILVGVFAVVMIVVIGPISILPLVANQYDHFNLSIVGYDYVPDLFFLKSSRSESTLLDPKMDYWETAIELVHPIDFSDITTESGRALYPNAEECLTIFIRHFLPWGKRVYLHKGQGVYKNVPVALRASEDLTVKALDPHQGVDNKGIYTIAPTFELIFAQALDSEILSENAEEFYALVSKNMEKENADRRKELAEYVGQ